MKKIQLECFVKDENCQLTSAVHKMEFGQTDREYSLLINNHSQNDCELKIESRFVDSPKASPVNLLISDNNKLFFRGALLDFSSSVIDLQSIKANSSQEYLFNLEMSPVSTDLLNFTTQFDLVFDFDCQQTVASRSAAVLAASTAAQPSVVISPEQNNNLPVLIYLCGSCLFVLVFFVIIKFINGKKKKNQ